MSESYWKKLAIEHEARLDRMHGEINQLLERIQKLERRQSSYVTHTGGNDWNVVVGADYTTPPKIEEP